MSDGSDCIFTDERKWVQIDREIDRQIDRQIDRKIERYIDRQIKQKKTNKLKIELKTLLLIWVTCKFVKFNLAKFKATNNKLGQRRNMLKC